MAFFEQLTERFYERVASDEVLRPLYPDDLGPPRRRLCLFLAQFWGGPRLYEEQRGNPQLRARHMRWEIGLRERDRWLEHMVAALEASPAGPLERAQLRGHFEAVANHLVNAGDAAGQTGRRGAPSAGPGLRLRPPAAERR